MKILITIISLLLLSTGCITKNFNKINTDTSGHFNLTQNETNLISGTKQRKKVNKHDVNNRAYKAKLTIEKLCRKRVNLGKNAAINNINKRSKSLAIIKTLELMTKNERANFMRIYNNGNNTISSLLSQQFKHSSGRCQCQRRLAIHVSGGHLHCIECLEHQVKTPNCFRAQT